MTRTLSSCVVSREAWLRDEALLMLVGRGMVLETALEVSRLLAESGVEGAIVGGIAVVLHGHVRTTRDVDVYVARDPGPLADRLTESGFVLDAKRREFVREGVSVHLVRPDQIPDNPRSYVEIDGIRTVSLADLISIKLRSGSWILLWAQDLADVIGLIRHHDLNASYASQLPKDLRVEFRKLVRAIAREN